jgi:hypothetical protein
MNPVTTAPVDDKPPVLLAEGAEIELASHALGDAVGRDRS